MFKKSVLFAALASCIFACQQITETEPQPVQEEKSFDNSQNPFRYMETIPQTPEGIVVKREKGLDGEDERVSCSVSSMTETRPIENWALLGGSNGIIYPGSLFKGESILNGKYETITGITKRPMQVTFKINGLENDPVVTILPTDPNYFREYNKVIQQKVNGAQPARIDYYIERIRSEEQLNLAVGVNFKFGLLGSIKASYDFDSRDDKTRMMVKFTQVYFTAEMPIPEDGVYIEEYPDPAVFGSYSPMYISTLTYGRLAMFFMETSYSEEDTRMALTAAINFWVKGEGSVSSSQKEILESLNMKVATRGGSATDAVLSVNGYTDFVKYITQGGEFTALSRGALISYSFRNLSNHMDAVINMSANYEEKDCITLDYRDGEFIHDSQTRELYQVFDGKLRYIPDPKLLKSVYSFNYSMMINLSHSTILTIPRGEDFPVDMSLVHHVPTGTIYLKERNTIRPIASESAFNKYHFNWKGYVNFYNLDLYDVNPNLIKY